MRINGLDTREDALGTGEAYFAVDNSESSETEKIDYAALAAAIIAQYNGQTLAGSAQTVKAAIDGIAADYEDLNVATEIPANSDLDDYKTPGSYTASSNNIAASISNTPDGVNRAFRLDVINALGTSSGKWRQQRLLLSATAGRVYWRYYSGSNWGQWFQLPTRGEIDSAMKSIGTLAPSTIADLTAFLSIGGGIYRVANNSWVTNEYLPEGYGVLEVIQSGGTYAYMRLTTASGVVYKRAYNAETHAWTETAWEKAPSRTEIPEPPTTAGTYKLTCTVASGGAVTYSWISAT